MSSDSIFVPIDAQRLEEKLKSIAIAYDLIAVTLIGGDILLGGISKHWAWNGRTVSLSFNVVIAHSEHQSFKNSEFRNFLW